jgi:hypothetical protein
MKLTILLAALSLPTMVLANEIDLREDAVYYCTDTIRGGIQGGEVTSIVKGKYTLKVKSGVTTFDTTAPIDSSGGSVYTHLSNVIYLATLNGSLSVNVIGGKITFDSYYSLIQKDKSVNQYVSQGTCIKW